jgi:hypothetical protein
MATDLVGNVKLQEFISLLSDLNHQSVDAIKTGDTRVLEKMNVTVERMYEIQHNGTEDAYTAIEEDAQIIYKNFNALVTMIHSNEKETLDEATNEAVKKFLHNIFDANVRIVIAYGLA